MHDEHKDSLLASLRVAHVLAIIGIGIGTVALLADPYITYSPLGIDVATYLSCFILFGYACLGLYLSHEPAGVDSARLGLLKAISIILIIMAVGLAGAQNFQEGEARCLQISLVLLIFQCVMFIICAESVDE